MNKKIKIILIALISVIIVVVGCIIGLNFLKQGSPKMTISTSGGKVGKYVTVNIGISNNPGFMASLFEIDYDNDVLEYVEYSKNNDIGAIQVNNISSDDEIKIAIINDNDYEMNGRILQLKFKVKDTNKSATEIKVDVDDESFCNYNEEFFKVEDAQTVVKIKK